MSEQAIVFHTHLDDRRIAGHCERLRREVAGTMPVYLSFHAGEGAVRGVAEKMKADLVVTGTDAERLLPARCRELRRSEGRGLASGFPDLTWLPSLLNERLRGCDYVWMMEYDVDFAGSWGEFFGEAGGSDADLMGTTLFSRADDPGWMHWSWFEAPTEVPLAMHTRGFFPIMRLSRRLLERYAAVATDGSWRGHMEAILPTLARHEGFSLEDLGGERAWSRAGRRAWYRNTRSSLYLTPGTFVYRPPVSGAYYHEAPEAFAEAGLLYHPVKTTVTEMGPAKQAVRAPAAGVQF
jgi:hypothetical protein